MDIMNDSDFNGAIVNINEAIAIMSDVINKIAKLN